MGRLLLQGRSAGNCAEAFKVDGLDDQFCPPERYSRNVAYAHHCGGSNSLCQGLGSLGVVSATLLISTAVVCLICAYL